MYKIKDKFKGQKITHFLTKEFKGQKTICLNSATQDELKYLYEDLKIRTHIQKSHTSELIEEKDVLTKEIPLEKDVSVKKNKSNKRMI